MLEARLCTRTPPPRPHSSRHHRSGHRCQGQETKAGISLEVIAQDLRPAEVCVPALTFSFSQHGSAEFLW